MTGAVHQCDERATVVSMAARRAMHTHHLLLGLFTCEQAQEWMLSRQRMLNDRIPIDMLGDVGDYQTLLSLIHRIMDGAYS